MASNSEKGFANFLAHFKALISFCTGYAGKYNPSNPAIKLTNLKSLYDSANTSLADVKTATAALQTAVKNRREAFAPLKKLCTKLINALIACKAAKEIIDNAKTENNKIQGSRADDTKSPPVPPKTEGNAENAAPATDDAGDDDKHISASQQSYDQQLDHFEKLIQILAAEPKYTPNETELQVATLESVAADMKTANDDVIDGLTNTSNSQIARNNFFHAEETGIDAVAADVKSYIKSVFGAKSAEFKQVSKLQFK